MKNGLKVIIAVAAVKDQQIVADEKDGKQGIDGGGLTAVPQGQTHQRQRAAGGGKNGGDYPQDLTDILLQKRECGGQQKQKACGGQQREAGFIHNRGRRPHFFFHTFHSQAEQCHHHSGSQTHQEQRHAG